MFLLNNFRKNPKELASKLELISSYLDQDTNILSEPGKIKLQMKEGITVFKEAIQFLKNLNPLQSLEWDNKLYQSAKAHVEDIGPKGLLSYQSSDGTDPEDRISKYGNFLYPIGESIDFGPNDAIGVIISLTLDDGDENRTQRLKLFNSEYHKVGIACGIHLTEYKMCVIDFAKGFDLKIENFELEIKREKLNKNNARKNKEEEVDKLNKKIINLKEEINKLKKILSQKNSTITELKNQIKNLKENNENINSLKENMSKKDIQLNELKTELLNKNKELDKLLKNETLKRKDMMCINFTSSDQKINYAIPCIGSDIFAEVEEKLYKEYPEYRETNNFFIVNGMQILRFKTISENNIKNGRPVMLIIPINYKK